MKLGRCHECPYQGFTPVPPTRTDPDCFLILGEAPGKLEIRQRRPFVGKAGQLLRATLKNVGFDEEMWITNVALCRPPSGAPSRDAIRACRDRLADEIREAQPRTILLLGATALSLFQPEWKVSKTRGMIFTDAQGVPVIPTWHPAAVLRDPGKFRDFAHDIQTAVGVFRDGWHPEDPDVTVYPIKTPGALESMYSSLRTRLPLDETLHLYDKIVGVCDLETSELDVLHPNARVLRVGIAFSPEIAYSIYPEAWADHGAWECLRKMLESDRICWAGHNAIFDSKWLLKHLGIDWQFSFDTMLAHYCVDERPWGHGLKRVSREYFQASSWQGDLIDEYLGGDKSRSFDEIPDEPLDEYLGKDLHYTYRLVDLLSQKMLEEDTHRVHDKLLIPASRAFRDIELCGVLVDVDYLHQLKKRIEKELVELKQQLAQATEKEDFNPNSHVQVAHLVYDVLGKTPPGRRTTARDVIEPWAKDEPLIQLVIDYRQKSRVLSTYIKGLLSRVAVDGRIHSSFRVTGTSTGRLSSANPNLQNIPTVLGPEIRNAFIATPGWVFFDADYSQLELRVMAYYSRDEYLIEAYREGKDIHTFVASMMYGVPEGDVTYKQRYQAKYWDFGILYGRGAKSLAEEGELQCTVAEAQEFIDKFLGLFPDLARWITKQRENVLETGYTVTPTGRKRRFPLIMSATQHLVQRQSVNSPIQSLASDICLTALFRLHNLLDPEKARILLTVHDSILIEVKEGSVDEIATLVTSTMEDVTLIDFLIPFPVSHDIGSRWGSLVPWQEKLVKGV